MKSKAYLGIDVSKGYADFLLLDQDKQVLEAPFQLDDNKSGRTKLSELINQWFSLGLQELYCGLESTGGYEDNWYFYLKSLSANTNLKVARLNPKGVKSVSEAALKRTITDAVSAENIAVYIIAFPEKVQYGSDIVLSNSEFKEARQTLAFTKMITKQKVQLNNQLEKLLYQYFSEMLVYCRNGTPNWLLHMLTKYPSANQVAKAGVKMLTKINGVSVEKAVAIIHKAGYSDQTVNKQIKHLISETAKEIIRKKKLLEKENQLMINQFKNHDQVKLLSTITGIGVKSAVSIMLEIEDINRFKSSKKLCSFFGVHPTFKQSGDGTWGSKMSKKGRSEIRASLYMCCLTAIRADEHFKNIYTRFALQGMNHYQSMGVVMHKMLRIIYGVLKNQSKYDPNIDVSNIANAKKKKSEVEALTKALKQEKVRKSERYKENNSDAPISRIAAKKRKNQKESQSSTMKECTGSPPD